MDALVGTYLMRETLPFELEPPRQDRALVVVETRPLFFLPFVVASAVRTHPGWRLYVFGTPAVHALLDSHCKNYDQAATFTIEGTLTPQKYSKLLMGDRFWSCVTEEHVLIFQADCALVRSSPEEALRYDYIGPVCGVAHPDTFVMNGGLSLRRTSAMRRAVRELASRPELQEEPEDVAFCEVMRGGSYVLPTMETCDTFAIETRGNPDTAIGMHGTDKNYAPQALIARLLGLPGLPGFTHPQTAPAQI